MTKIQLSNYFVSVEDEKVILSNSAATWKMEVSVLNPRYMLLDYMVKTPEMHQILEAYCYVNYLAADNTFVDKKFLDDFTKAYNGCFKRYNDRMKSAGKEKEEDITNTESDGKE